jgi:anthranilate synthase component 1
LNAAARGNTGYVTRFLTPCPDLVAVHQARPDRYPHLLESTARGARGRYDILFAFPGETLALRRPADPDFLDTFDRWWLGEREPYQGGGPPFRGGWFVYLGYELARQIEPRLCLMDGGLDPALPPLLPLAFTTRFHAALIRDHANRGTLMLAEAGYDHLLDRIEEDIGTVVETDNGSLEFRVQEDDPRRFLDGVRRILRYIRAGDVFQVNLSRAWNARLGRELSPARLYRRLRRTNPAPFAGLATWDGTALLCSSPERLVSVEGERVQTRPIAGTRPRTADADDALAGEELLSHPKERAEHIMLIDLERNDLGRVCRPGSIEVNEFLALESYAHVHHIVSNVCGWLYDSVTPGRVIRALFPGGTITGCPKVRCMEIIAELERTARGPYTGAIGYINRDGDMDFNILIRTLVQRGSEISLRAGAGIVADSIPERELEETRAKAKGLLLALK